MSGINWEYDRGDHGVAAAVHERANENESEREKWHHSRSLVGEWLIRDL